MKKLDSEQRKKKITIRMTEAEYMRLNAHFKKSAYRKLSEYIRKMIFQNPITIRYRNESADEILAELSRIKKDLNGLGNNFNQAVHKLHTLNIIPEFRSWILLYENTRQIIEKKLPEIKDKMSKIYEHWLQK